MSEPLLEMRAIQKSFFGVPALRGVDLNVMAGEVLSLVGMNGAGKSTLSNIIAGIHRKDSGDIRINGKSAEFHSPKDAEKLGICMVSQEPTLCENMTVVDNIFLNCEVTKGGFLLDREAMKKDYTRIMDYLGYNVDPDAMVEDISLVAKGVVSIAKAMLRKPLILILDEVTAPLNNKEVDSLFEVIRGLKKTGIAVIFISHKLQEITAISDRVAVVRDGMLVGEFSKGKGSRILEKDIIHLMLGESEGWQSEFRERTIVERREDVLLTVKGLSRKNLYEEVSLELHKGEIVGIAGLKGGGITEFLFSLFGAISPDAGAIEKDGKVVFLSGPRSSKAMGIGMITNDRQREGLSLMLSVEDNIVISSLDKIRGILGVILPKNVRRIATQYIKALGLKTTGPSQPVQYLSGGNQQKIVVAKWLLRDCQVLLIDEPTRGVDVKAKNQIYDLLHEQKLQHKGIIIHSPEVRELLNLCDRILLMAHGRVVKEFSRGEQNFTEKDLLAAIHSSDHLPGDDLNLSSP